METSEVGIARCNRLAREGQQDVLNELLEAHRNQFRVLATSCLHLSDTVEKTSFKAHQNFPHFRGTTEFDWMVVS